MEKIINGFKWEIVPYEKAKQCEDPLYILYTDGSESQVECYEDVVRAKKMGLLLGIERGFV